MKILIIHGPHLSLMGKVSSKNSSRLTMDKVNRHLRKKAGEKGLEVKIFQHFGPKNILKTLLANRKDVDGIIINIGAMARGFYALQEMLAIIDLPVVELMLSEFPFSRENFDYSAIKEVADKRIYENGLEACDEALDYFINI